MDRSSIPDPAFPPLIQHIVVMWDQGTNRWVCVSGPLAPDAVGASLNYFRATYPARRIRVMTAVTSYGPEKTSPTRVTAVATLNKLRKAMSLSQKATSRRLGVAQSRVSAIERDSIAPLRVATLARYITAIGGRLRVSAEFDGWTVDLDWEDIPESKQEDK